MSNIKSLLKKFIPIKLFKVTAPYWHLMESIAANIRFGFPSRKMHVIGVTGTNGKTTTTNLIHRMLHYSGYKVGMMSTVSYGVGDDIKDQVEHITTAPPMILQRRLADFKKAGVEYLVLETSSHSLAQHRTWGVPYEIAVMTNVTSDHLDYHENFDNYLEAKRRLFTLASKNGRKFGVINADDPNAQKFIDSIPRVVTYGIKDGELRAENIKIGTDFVEYDVNHNGEKYNIHVNIAGDFNVSNSLAAMAVGLELGLTKKQIENGIASLKSVEGRMTVVEEGQKFKVIVDFASSSDAFDRLFNSIRPATKGKLVSVFGSAGRRDEAKRPVQGEIAGKYCDEIVLTEEDNRDIDGDEIMNQIAEGSMKAGMIIDKNLFLIPNREEAIKFALTRVDSIEDTVVLLGKGHEKTIERADGSHPWNEIQTTRKMLKNLSKKKTKK